MELVPGFGSAGVHTDAHIHVHTCGRYGRSCPHSLPCPSPHRHLPLVDPPPTQPVLARLPAGLGAEHSQDVCCCSVAQSCLTVWDPMDCSTPGFPVHYLPDSGQSLLKLMSVESVMPSNHLILCHSLLLLPSIFPSIRVFSSESALQSHQVAEVWSFSFSISPSNEYSGLIPFRIDWFDLGVQGTLKS